MKALIISAALSLGVAYAADADSQFAKAKAQILEHITAQMTTLENTKKCIEAATDRDTVKKCHEQAREERQKFEGQRIDNQIKNLEAKKKALEEKKK